jgi:hypothetical protein
MSKKTESKTIPPQPELDLMLGDKTHPYVSGFATSTPSNL